ncbi:MAG: hypothetical protein A2Y53_07640 [Chloroflexi bacterium RBG_16_47_49]|nr:MAG: hypothetical protein A2Y53_07640 [Chloroflexi bacterium RBG_16_47_49]
MTYTQRMYAALKRLGRQRQEEGKLSNQYDDLIGEIDRLNKKIEELETDDEPCYCCRDSCRDGCECSNQMNIHHDQF